MNDLDLEIRDLAEDIVTNTPEFAPLIEKVLAIRQSAPDAPGLALRVLRLFGPDSLIALLALLLESDSDSKPITDLPTPDRIATKAALLQLADGLTALATSGHAEDAAYHLNPAN